MARSLRNNQSLKAKSVKRKGFFTEVVDARAERIAKKLQEDLKKQQASKPKAEDNVDEIVVDGEEKEPKKVSTSGWRTSRHVTYKKNKIKKNKRRVALVFKKK